MASADSLKGLIVRSTHGDEVASTTVRHPLKGTLRPRCARSCIDGHAGLQLTGDDLWSWTAAGASATGKPAAANHVVTTTFSDGSVSMGSVELEAETLKLEMNSPQRARRGQAPLEPVIRPFVGEPVVVSQTVAEMWASRPASDSRKPSSGLSPKEDRAIM